MKIENFSEMLAAQNLSHELVCKLEDVERLMRSAWMRFFGTPSSGDDPRENTEEIGVLLSVCADYLHDALLSYRLEVGADGPDVDRYFSEVEERRTVRELFRLVREAHGRKDGMSGPELDAFSIRLAAAEKMRPAAAVAALQDLLGGGEKNVE